jgi:Domain of unknown function (DUF4167)
MRPGQNKRMRGRNRRGPNPLTRSFESNGPDVKVRGTAQHIAEKYTQLARDAHVSGDPVMAESYLQHAEHYYRLIASAQAAQLAIQNGTANEDDEDDDFDTASDRFNPRNVSSQQSPNAPQGGERRDGEEGEGAEASGEEGGERRPEGQRSEGNRGEGNREGRGDRFGRDRNRDRNNDRGFRQNRDQNRERPPFDPNNRPRRPVTDLEGAEQPVLPAFLTAPPRAIPSEGAEGGEPAPAPAAGEEMTGLRPRRRRRTRGPREGGEGGDEGATFEAEGAAE